MTTHEPGGRRSRQARGASEPFDARERAISHRIGRDFPHWLVMWGLHSRRFWAFPCFRVPRGTFAEAASPDDLVAEMRSIQHAAMRGAGR
jgi:hypothetical protein